MMTRDRFVAPCSVVLLTALGACWYDVPDVVTDASMLDGTGDAPPADAPAEAQLDAAPDGGCNTDAAFGAPKLIGELASGSFGSYDETYPRMSADERTIFFSIGPPFVVHTATRADAFGTFSPPIPLPGLASTGSDLNITISADGRVALLSGFHSGTNTSAAQLFSAERANADAGFSGPFWEGTTFGASFGDVDPYFFGAGYDFYYAIDAGPDLDIGEAQYIPGCTASPCDGHYNGIGSTGPLNVAKAADRAPAVDPTETLIYFASNRSSDGGAPLPYSRVWTSARGDSQLAWGAPQLVAELATDAVTTNPRPGWLSPNGCRLYLTLHDSTAGHDRIYVASK